MASTAIKQDGALDSARVVEQLAAINRWIRSRKWVDEEQKMVCDESRTVDKSVNLVYNSKTAKVHFPYKPGRTSLPVLVDYIHKPPFPGSSNALFAGL